MKRYGLGVQEFLDWFRYEEISRAQTALMRELNPSAGLRVERVVSASPEVLVLRRRVSNLESVPQGRCNFADHTGARTTVTTIAIESKKARSWW